MTHCAHHDTSRRSAGRLLAAAALIVAACASSEPTATPSPTGAPPVHVVVFTHIEDNTPGPSLTDPAARIAYVNLRSRLIEMARLTRRYNVAWALQPDWKFLLAALQFEDAALRASTGGWNVLRFLRDSLGVAIDPHSHENGGYNYTDVAHLLDSLGVGGSTVIGGHIWDPNLPTFQRWDRFRVPVAGLRFPAALWRGDILMGSGTPNHVNDPIVSGVWRPASRDRYWADDSAGNISAIGAFRGTLASITELSTAYKTGAVKADCMLTASIHAKPATLTAVNGIAAAEDSIVKPLAALRDAGSVTLTSFTALVTTWRASFGGRACLYGPL
ncbi:MAG: hypothetical protein FJ363_04550 [Gemmatimonadetes bacterium]|nr:hypothetical protein [Gemmatimonadota bacterium]